MLKFIVLFSAQIFFAVTLFDPSKIYQHYESVLTPDLKLMVKDLGRTINGWTIIAYGITRIKQLDLQKDSQLIKQLPSVLLTSYMHPRDQHSNDILLSFMHSVIISHQKDYYMNYVLDHGMIWFIPFINIDAYQLLVRTGKWSNFTNQQKILYTNNFHKYPDENKEIDCPKQYMHGVDLNLNFMHDENVNKDDPCGQLYGGPFAMSEAEIKSVKQMFDEFNIKVLIDLQAKGDKWIAPYSKAKNKLSSHPFYNIYQDIIKKLRKAGYNIGTAKQVNLSQSSTTFSEWAAQKYNCLSFTLLFGQQFFMERSQIQESAKKAFLVFDMLAKKVTPIYQKYRSPQSTILKIISLSIIDYNITCTINVQSGEYSLQKSFQMKPGATVSIEFQSYLQINSKSAEIILQVKDSLIRQVVQLKDIQVDNSISDIYNNEINEEDDRPWVKILFWIMVSLVICRFVYRQIRTIQRRRQRRFRQREQEEEQAKILR